MRGRKRKRGWTMAAVVECGHHLVRMWSSNVGGGSRCFKSRLLEASSRHRIALPIGVAFVNLSYTLEENNQHLEDERVLDMFCKPNQHTLFHGVRHGTCTDEQSTCSLTEHVVTPEAIISCFCDERTVSFIRFGDTQCCDRKYSVCILACEKGYRATAIKMLIDL
ncbi:hypothetical protein JTE90_009841 [Oedothorax gibbosus]|uniref:Uncharacterized protein n=1 Tax=Oedothorax gibbosus TaxID=931172 RepID=A0AAV6TZ98_9ARAC|nr:hypothetical protein JTE90_009841 [Oedothorax gibbosus]